MKISLPNKNVTLDLSLSTSEEAPADSWWSCSGVNSSSTDAKTSSKDLFELLGVWKGGLEGKMFCLQRQALHNKRENLTLVWT